MSSPRGVASPDVYKGAAQDPLRQRLQLVSRQPRAVLETLLIIAALVAHLVFLPHDTYSDALRRYNELDGLLAHGSISDYKYSLIGPLFATPLWLLGHLVRDPVWWVSRFNLVFFSLGLLGIYVILKDKVDRALIRKFLLILAVASMFPASLSTFYGETFTAVAIGVGVLAALFGPRILGWAAVAVGVANTPATLVGMGLATLLRVLSTGRVRYIGALVGAVGLIVGENLVRHHTVTNPSYEPGFTYPVIFGMLSIVFSFGKGLIFFAPAIFLPIRSYLLAAGAGGIKLYRAYGMWIAFIIGMVPVYGGWWDWSGDWFWGPRFFLLASLPCSLALAVRLHRPAPSLPGNLTTFVLLCLCSWIGINGAVFNLDALAGPCGQLGESICTFLPQSSALWYPLISFQLMPGVTGVKSLAYLGVALLVFVYLASPLLLTIARQAVTALRALRWVFIAGGEEAEPQG